MQVNPQKEKVTGTMEMLLKLNLSQTPKQGLRLCYMLNSSVDLSLQLVLQFQLTKMTRSTQFVHKASAHKLLWKAAIHEYKYML